MKQIKSLLLLLICVTFISFNVKAGNNKDNKKNPVITTVDGSLGIFKHHPKEGNRVPINGGLSLLFAAGAVFGTKKIMSKRRENLSVVK